MSKPVVYFALAAFLMLAGIFPLRDYLIYFTGGSEELSDGRWSAEGRVVGLQSSVSYVFFGAFVLVFLLSCAAALWKNFRLRYERAVPMAFGFFVILWAIEIFIPINTIVVNGQLLEIPASFIQWFFVTLAVFLAFVFRYLYLAGKTNDGTPVR